MVTKATLHLAFLSEDVRLCDAQLDPAAIRAHLPLFAEQRIHVPLTSGRLCEACEERFWEAVDDEGDED